MNVNLRFSVYIILILISSLRTGIGTDFHNYEEMYKSNALENIEPLFYFIFIRIPNSLSLSSNWFFVLTSVFSNFLVFAAIEKSSRYKVVSVVLYVLMMYFTSFNIVRQFTAIATFVYTVPRLLDYRKVKTNFLILIFITFLHYSFIIILPFFVLYYFIKMRLYKYMLLISFFAIVMLSDKLHLESLVNGILVKFVALDFFKSLNNSITGFFMLKTLLLLFAIFYFKKSIDHIKYLIPLFIYIYFVSFLFYQAPVIAVRIFYYADILFLVYIFGNNEVRIRFHGLTVIMLILCVQCITFYNKTIINGENGVFVKGKFQFKQDNPIDELEVW